MLLRIVLFVRQLDIVSPRAVPCPHAPPCRNPFSVPHFYITIPARDLPLKPPVH